MPCEHKQQLRKCGRVYISNAGSTEPQPGSTEPQLVVHRHIQQAPSIAREVCLELVRVDRGIDGLSIGLRHGIDVVAGVCLLYTTAGADEVAVVDP